MARLGCKCGAIMGTTQCPSPFSLFVYYKDEIEQALSDDPDITLFDFLTDWDEKNKCQKEFMHRAERVDYWYCRECRRVYEVQLRPKGHWLRVYKRSDEFSVSEHSDWSQIYVMSDVETYAATEANSKIRLTDYMAKHDAVRYYLSPDETTVYVKNTEDGKILCSYSLEEALPSDIE